MVRILFTSFLLLITVSMQGQQVRAYLSNERVRVGDELIVHVEIKGFHKEARPLFPILKEGSKKGDTQELSLQGGSLTIYSQAYVFKDTGTVNIPSFEVRLDEEVINSGDMIARILPAPPKPDANIELPAISLEVLFDRDTVYLGEQVRLKMVLVVPEEEKGNVRISDFAKARLREGIPKKAFWEEKLPRQPLKSTTMQRDGKTFHLLPLLETYLFPLQTGIFPFGDQYMSYELKVEKEGATTSDILLEKNYQTMNLLPKAEPQSLIVLPVPGREEETAVGDLSLEAKLSSATVATGEPFYMELILSGRANFSTLPAPEFKPNKLFDYESPAVDYEFRFGDSLAKGQRSYTYQITPAYPGKYDLGPISYTYFDPVAQRMKTLSQQLLMIEVTGDALPEMLTNSEGSFYFRAFESSSENQKWRIPYLRYVSLILLGISLFGLVWGGRKISRRTKM